MNFNAFITCAVTGSGNTVGKHPGIPQTPEQIANAAIEAAREGAAIAHIHVRDPETGAPSRKPEYFAEVIDRIRDSDTDVIINTTAGMGGDLVFGCGENPLPLNPAGTDMAGPLERLAHVEQCLPEICTLDCGTMNFAESDYVMTNTPGMLKIMAKKVQELGVRPELEVFDTGHLVFVKELIREGLIDDPVMIQLCMGIPYGAPDDPSTLMSMVHALPPGVVFSAFSIGRNELPYVAMAVLAGGNVRVGLEDNLYLSRGVFATNGQLVERAVTILSAMGVNILGPDAVREQLKLRKHG
ncbi:MAG: 3-keto-5-aminohexanoate cleavage protein [Gammaproteobacteria bacterium]|nr:3-keto-5-aminohexanoate cleavage protein [Gammaproteobacteria bacterium]MYD75732.1 3-keto-5-aminohexanoate cleavage protein [Gammaproteobacteria bacterium]MYJ51839.1 3-keto-5-aminohexanoate cleavage protein [Gammaproteobacteria bacterium]